MSHVGPSFIALESPWLEASGATELLSPKTSAARLLTSEALTVALSGAAAGERVRAESARAAVSRVTPLDDGLASSELGVVIGTGATLGAGGWAQPTKTAAIEMSRTFFTSLTLVNEPVPVYLNALSGSVVRSKRKVRESSTHFSVSRDNSRGDDWSR
jgi:hypothetical protein